jgi:hypothetical protein
MFGGACEDVLGACASLPAPLVLFCFFFTAVAAFAGVTMGTAATVVANMASTRSRMADLFMHFSCWWGDRPPEV